MTYTKESKAVSYCLRHGAEKIGLAMDRQGFVNVDELVVKVHEQGYEITRDILQQIVDGDSKGRYCYSGTGDFIRANQGHSLQVDLGLVKQVPPVVLYHGTCTKVKDLILKSGVQKMRRTHVHLSDNITTAFDVGTRHGRPIVFKVDCKAMLAAGVAFYRSENHVWLVDYVDPIYLTELIF